jgi:hypothetical protein
MTRFIFLVGASGRGNWHHVLYDFYICLSNSGHGGGCNLRRVQLVDAGTVAESVMRLAEYDVNDDDDGVGENDDDCGDKDDEV